MTGPTVLGIDLGTSAVKAVLVDRVGHTHAASTPYPLHEPRPGWAEQEVGEWWQATVAAVRALRAAPEAAAGLKRLEGIGLSGQMHGTVVLDGQARPLRPAIIWADGRSGAEAAALNAAYRASGLTTRLGGFVASGFMAATLAWLRRHEPETWAAMATCVLPKDALRLCLTGGPPLTDASDASSTLLLDLERRDWSAAALAQVGIRPEVLPPVREAAEVAGPLSAAAADALLLPAGVPVLLGGADQGMALVGAGAVHADDLLVSLSSGGQLVAPATSPTAERDGRSHTFCHVLSGQTFVQAATLAAGLSLRWLRHQVFGDIAEEAFAGLLVGAAALPPGAEGLLFLPNLLGERFQNPDLAARGVLAGLGLRHGQAHLLRAVLEGVAFSLREALGLLLTAGVRPRRLVAVGGGMRLPLWRQVLADVLGRTLLPVASADQSALGAAIVAGCAVGVFPDLDVAVGGLVHYDAPISPNPAAVASYDAMLPRYRRLAALSQSVADQA